MEGPHAGQIDLHATVGDQPADLVGETIEATGETAWYELRGGNGIPGLVTFTYAYGMTVPAAARPGGATRRCLRYRSDKTVYPVSH